MGDLQDGTGVIVRVTIVEGEIVVSFNDQKVSFLVFDVDTARLFATAIFDQVIAVLKGKENS
jgi:hypothetical protein